jgi:hypothetical protein
MARRLKEEKERAAVEKLAPPRKVRHHPSGWRWSKDGLLVRGWARGVPLSATPTWQETLPPPRKRGAPPPPAAAAPQSRQDRKPNPELMAVMQRALERQRMRNLVDAGESERAAAREVVGLEHRDSSSVRMDFRRHRAANDPTPAGKQLKNKRKPRRKSED